MTHFLAAAAAAGILACLTQPSFAGTHVTVLHTPLSQAMPAADTRKSGKQLGGKPIGRLPTTGVAELSAWDCTIVGGKVITVADDRCGASGKYCRMPDTNAICIEEKK